MTCNQCNQSRRISDQEWLIGEPCDICNDTGHDYLGRPCRHCRPVIDTAARYCVLCGRFYAGPDHACDRRAEATASE